jgi:hypothetical protein
LSSLGLFILLLFLLWFGVRRDRRFWGFLSGFNGRFVMMDFASSVLVSLPLRLNCDSLVLLLMLLLL